MRGFKLLEKSIGGINSGELIVIGGRPYMKKEILMEQIINAIVSDGVKGLYFFNQFNERNIINDSIDITFSSSQDIETLIDIIRNEVTKDGLSVVFIDSLERISYSSVWLSGNKRKKVVCKLRRLAEEIQVTIIALSELSEKVETRRPNNPKPILSDLNGVQDFADKVILINRPEYYGITEDAEGFKTDGIYFMEIFNRGNTKSNVIRFDLKKNTNEFIELGTAKHY